MTQTLTLNLSELVDPPKTNSISGRRKGQGYAEDKEVLKHLMNNEKVILIIDGEVIKAINDSFIKGFFSKIFEKYNSKEIVTSLLEIKSNQYFKDLINKNLTILDSIYR